jgi:hypothetical protein
MSNMIKNIFFLKLLNIISEMVVKNFTYKKNKIYIKVYINVIQLLC